jgi:putative transposase
VKVLSRKVGRPKLRRIDKAFLAACSRVVPRHRWGSFIVAPSTLLRWHRELVRRKWTYKQKRLGCPPIDPALASLSCRMGREIWRRRPPDGKTICHTDHGSQYTSWAFGRRLRAAGLLGSMGSIGDCFDNSLAESFFGTLQLELLDRHRWQTREELASAIFDYLKAFYNPRRRHSSIGNFSPAEFESRHTADADAA